MLPHRTHCMGSSTVRATRMVRSWRRYLALCSSRMRAASWGRSSAEQDDQSLLHCPLSGPSEVVALNCEKPIAHPVVQCRDRRRGFKEFRLVTGFESGRPPLGYPGACFTRAAPRKR